MICAKLCNAAVDQIGGNAPGLFPVSVVETKSSLADALIDDGPIAALVKVVTPEVVRKEAIRAQAYHVVEGFCLQRKKFYQ